MGTVRIAVSFDKSEPEFPFFKIADSVVDFDTIYSDEKSITVEYQVYDTDVAFVEEVINNHVGVHAYTINDIVQ